MLDLGRRLCREIASACGDQKIARSIASRKTIAAVVSLARADRRIAATAPDPSCRTPLWLKFLERVCKGDAEFITFLQRVVGYGLTGFTREHALFFCHGTGANGKSTFVNAVTGCIADYHRVAPIETFTAAKNDRHPTKLAALRGARLVTSVETEEGRRAEGRQSKLRFLGACSGSQYDGSTARHRSFPGQSGAQ